MPDSVAGTGLTLLTRRYARWRAGDGASHSWALPILFALLAVIGLSLTSRNEVTWEQHALVFIMFALSACSYAHWSRHRKRTLPVYAAVTGMYSLFFGLALFWVVPVSPSYLDQGALLPQEALTASLRMVVMGLVAVWIGMHLGLARQFTNPRRLPDIPASRLRSPWIRFLLAFGCLSGFLQGLANQFGSLQNPAIILFVFVPLVPLAILLDRYWAGAASKADKFLIAAFLLCRSAAGLSSGTLGSLVSVGFLVAGSYVRARRAIPWAAVIVGVLVMLFFQPGKRDYRQRFWSGAETAGVVERGAYWIQASWDLWSSFFTSADPEIFNSLASMSVERTSLLTQAAVVVEKTPDVVPFQHGRTYAYMAVTLIPRLLWSGKPSFNEANVFYQVAYGLTRESDLATVSIAVGVLPEAYMNFGWAGVAGMMFLIGVVYDFYAYSFFSIHSGRFASALGLALFVQVVTIELQLAQYLGGIGQQLFLTFVVMAPVLRFPPRRVFRSSAVQIA